MDALTALLDGLSLRARLIYTGGVCGRWGIDHNSVTDIWFHLVTKGSGWIHSHAWSDPLPMDYGDLVLFMPHAKKHYLSYSSDELLFDAPGARKASLVEGTTGFVCGMIELGMPNAVLWQALPPEIIVRRRDAGDALGRLVELIIQEAGEQRFGGLSLVERLCDGLLLLALRHCVEHDLVRQGLFMALRDKRLEKVFSLVHTEPWRPWTLQQLCEQAGISKTALTEKFDALIGCPPMEYLTQLRLQFAATWLKDSALSVERVAERCGYDSTSAFSRAFKRSFGVAPGNYRFSTTGKSRPVDPTT